MRIVFIGTSEFAVPILQTIKEQTDWNVVLVVTEPAKPAGRKQKIVESPVCVYAKSAGLKIITPPSLKSAEVADEIKSVQPDVMIVAAYGKIIPPEVFNLPPHKTINVHPSLLPKLRGPSPIQTALLEGLKETGVSLMIIDEQVDHGPILSQDGFPIVSDDTYLILEKNLSQLGADMLIRDLPQHISGELKPQEQNHDQTTFTQKISKEYGRTDWQKMSSDDVHNLWRAYIKWPGIHTFFRNGTGKNIRLKLIELEKWPTPDVGQRLPGEAFVSDHNLYITCRKGAVKITKLQPESSKILTAKEFLNGHHEITGQVLY